MLDNLLKFWSTHVLLSNWAHIAGGAGLAIVLQRYLKGNPFIHVAMGWVLLGFSVVVHIYAFFS